MHLHIFVFEISRTVLLRLLFDGKVDSNPPESSDEGETQRSRLSFTNVAGVTPRREAIISSAAVRSAWPKTHRTLRSSAATATLAGMNSPPPERATSTVVPPLPGPDSGVADAIETASTTTKLSPPPGSAKNCCAFRETSTVAAGSPVTAGGERHCSRLGASRHVAATLVSLPRREKRQVGAEPLPSPAPVREAAEGLFRAFAIFAEAPRVSLLIERVCV